MSSVRNALPSSSKEPTDLAARSAFVSVWSSTFPELTASVWMSGF